MSRLPIWTWEKHRHLFPAHWNITSLIPGEMVRIDNALTQRECDAVMEWQQSHTQGFDQAGQSAGQSRLIEALPAGQSLGMPGNKTGTLKERTSFDAGPTNGPTLCVPALEMAYFGILPHLSGKNQKKFGGVRFKIVEGKAVPKSGAAKFEVLKKYVLAKAAGREDGGGGNKQV